MKPLSLTCFVLFLYGFVAADDVPVIIWGPHIQHQAAAAMKSHNVDEFLTILTEHSADNTIIFIVAEDQLSVEDLSQCKAPNNETCFKGIQNIKSKLYFPSVEDPAPIIYDLAGLDRIEVNLLSSGNLSAPLTYATGMYIFVNFDDDSEDETTFVKLARHDNMLTTFYNEFLLQNDGLRPLVVYTGKQASHSHLKRFVREVFSPYPYAAAATNSTNSSTDPIPKVAIGFIWQTELMWMYYTSMTWPENEENSSVNVTTWPTTNGRLFDIQVLIETNNTDTIQFVITTNDGHWSVNQFTWNNESVFPNRLISAPDEFSYHCTLEISLTDQNGSVVLIWKGLQLQPIFVKGQLNKSFGDAFDCVGFVSPVILSGLLVTFMLLFVLSIGISCMMDIKPIIRFDNPKGKTITVIADG